MKSKKNDKIYNAIKAMAVDYEFRPDENINESHLASRLGVSRTPVRDALNRLLNEGLMVFYPNRGFFCRSLSAEELFDLAEVRLGLERLALERALERGSKASRRDLVNFWSDVDLRMDRLSSREVARLDEEFHERIVRMADNAVLLAMIQQLNARIRFVRRIEVEKPTRMGADFEEHFKIAKALLDNNKTLAMERLVFHLTFTRDNATHVLKEGLAQIFMKKRSAASQLSAP